MNHYFDWKKLSVWICALSYLSFPLIGKAANNGGNPKYEDTDIKAFQEAILNQSLASAEKIVTALGLKGVELADFISEPDDDGYTALHYAAKEEDLDAVKWLLEEGAYVNALNKSDETALHLIIDEDSGREEEDNLEIIALLMEAGADPSIGKQGGSSPFRMARSDGSDYILYLLSGAEPNGYFWDKYEDGEPVRVKSRWAHIGGDVYIQTENETERPFWYEKIQTAGFNIEMTSRWRGFVTLDKSHSHLLDLNRIYADCFFFVCWKNTVTFNLAGSLFYWSDCKGRGKDSECYMKMKKWEKYLEEGGQLRIEFERQYSTLIGWGRRPVFFHNMIQRVVYL